MYGIAQCFVLFRFSGTEAALRACCAVNPNPNPNPEAALSACCPATPVKSLSCLQYNFKLKCLNMIVEVYQKI